MAIERAVPNNDDWAELAAPSLARYLFAAEHTRRGRVLDAGTGSGYGAAILQASGAGAVVAVDRDPQTIAAARQRFAAPGLEFVVDDCESLGVVAGPFDLICCYEAIEHFARPERFLAAAARLLSPEGVLLVSTPDQATARPLVKGRPHNPFHVREWCRDEFQQLLAGHFSQIEMRVQVRTLALEKRLLAVEALRRGLLWSNPLLVALWRKLPLFRRRRRAWKQLEGLAAPSAVDYPILPVSTASLFGTSCYHVALCRRGV